MTFLPTMKKRLAFLIRGLEGIEVKIKHLFNHKHVVINHRIIEQNLLKTMILTICHFFLSPNICDAISSKKTQDVVFKFNR